MLVQTVYELRRESSYRQLLDREAVSYSLTTIEDSSIQSTAAHFRVMCAIKFHTLSDITRANELSVVGHIVLS